jgi:beta-glucanase (GH16 family)
MMRSNTCTCTTLLLLGALFINSLPAAAQKKQGWKLIWKEEFNYTGLPKEKNWGYETGYVRNKEQQYYTKARKENIWVEQGLLHITGRKEAVKDTMGQYTSASINTLGKAGWKYGRIEVRAKLPKGGGIWPAIWMMGSNRNQVGWPACGEIDVMEFIGNHPKEVYGTIHYPITGPAKSKSNGGKTTSETLNTEFHVYAIEWDKDKIEIFLDDQKYHTFFIDTAGTGEDNPFRKPQYLLLNLAMGANWPGPIDESVLPQQFLVDYVRVYQRK